MDLLPLSSLPTMIQMISLSPNTGDQVLHTPFLFWRYIFFFLRDLADFLETQTVFFQIHILKVGLHKKERKVGGPKLVPPLVFTST